MLLYLIFSIFLPKVGNKQCLGWPQAIKLQSWLSGWVTIIPSGPLSSEQMQASCELYVKNVVLVLVDQLTGNHDTCHSKWNPLHAYFNLLLQQSSENGCLIPSLFNIVSMFNFKHMLNISFQDKMVFSSRKLATRYDIQGLFSRWAMFICFQMTLSIQVLSDLFTKMIPTEEGVLKIINTTYGSE